MIADLGFTAVLVAFLASVYTIGAAWYGKQKDDIRWVMSARNATVATFPLLGLACGLLITLLVTGDFSIEYVWRVSSIDMPQYLKVTAMWGGQAGSLLLWNFILAAFTAVAMAQKWNNQKELMPYALMIAATTQIFFLLLTLFLENPFARLEVVPPNGNGLNPLLRHPGMIIHPPMLYLGYVGFVVPYIFAMAALMSGKLDDGWIKTTRRWTLVAWLFLSLGIILGGRWAYDVLGWGGYWAWDPVENASFMPWLSGTAFLHSAIIQEKRNIFKVWNMSLIILTYLLVVYGTFIVRSGIISSVHSFAQSAVGPYFFAFLGIMTVLSLYWLFKRIEDLGTENTLDSFFSREAAFLLNNFIFIAILVIVFVLTNFPIISEIFTNERSFVGPPVYEQALAPLFGVMVLLMGVAPLTAWYKTSPERIGMPLRWPALAATLFVIGLLVYGIREYGGLAGIWVISFSVILTLLEFWKGTRSRMNRGESAWKAFSTLMTRNRRRYGGYWIHMGVLIMAFGIIGVEIFQSETQIRLQRGESIGLGRYEMVFNGMSEFPGPDDLIISQAVVDVFENGEYVRTLTPRTELYTRTQQPMTIPAAVSTIFDDFYILVVNWEGVSANAATFRLYLNPLINWVWAGGMVFVIGTLIAAWPEAEKKKPVAAPKRKRVQRPLPSPTD
ncbi:MAG: heme lyase CcmF/NrfE family subunit [Chloroflexota bacterium]